MVRDPLFIYKIEVIYHALPFRVDQGLISLDLVIIIFNIIYFLKKKHNMYTHFELGQ